MLTGIEVATLRSASPFITALLIVSCAAPVFEITSVCAAVWDWITFPKS